MVRRRFIVPPETRVDLSAIDTRQSDGLSKKEGREQVIPIKARLNELQELLYATGQHALLIVLQGMDTSGKDGVIKHVAEAFNPQGCQITGFKVPSREELAHDFLWRVHKVTPPRGMVGIFNRSHYEDVLVVRVDELVPKAIWRRRFEAINDFEELLTENGVVIVKFYLHISPEEQLARLEDRLANRRDQWKFKVSDLEARAKWPQYMAAYTEALERCSTAHAPWYIIPADRKWYRNLIVSQILVETLEELKLEWPPLEPEAVGLKIK